MSRRVLVIGLDCAPPKLVFEHLRDAMPHLSSLVARGTWGPLRSTVPPITVPAWVTMTTGRDPGELGLYGFRNRVAGSYELALPTSRDVRFKRIWDLLGENGHRVAALFVPLTFPPPPVRGQVVSGFMTPDTESEWAFPRGLRDRVVERFGEYRIDVEGFRTEDTARVLRDLHAMADQHFAIARWTWTEHAPDFLMMVEMGPDRLHHAAFHHLDPSHPRHDPDHPLVAECVGYYAALDARLGELVGQVDDETVVMIVSDHGARPMEGGFRVNEWLRREGWLALREEPEAPTALEPSMVDWSRTRAWSTGGYYARVFLNVEGREPEGIIPAGAREDVRRELARALERVVEARVVVPEDEFRAARGLAPDLMVFLKDLALRSVGTVGGDEGIFTATNDTGPDACNHDWDGIFVMAGGGTAARGRVEGLGIEDVTPTVLALFDVPRPEGMHGRDLTK